MLPITYTDFLRAGCSLAPFGILPGETESAYVCTPRGAVILGWTGVDGIHYVQIPTLGDLVFAVNPYADPGRHAHPVAENFADFLCLLAKCGHESYLEQAHGWTWEQYERFSQENPVTAEQNAAAEQIVSRFGLTRISDVYTYVKKLDAAFDYGTIPYSDEYWEYVPRESVPREDAWRVYFSKSFGERGGHGEKAGEELPMDTRFSWDGRRWHVPAIYLCPKGLVMDLVASATQEEMQAHAQRWKSKGELSPSEERAAEAESPLRDDFVPSVQINGRCSRMERMTTLTLPADGRELSPTDRSILGHYGLDEHTPMLLCRIAFPWVTSKKPKLHSLQLTLSRRPSVRTGEPFALCAAGERVAVTHPISGAVHTLTVHQLQTCNLQESATAHLPFRVPTSSVQLLYTLSPDLPDSEFSLRDVRHNDMPIKQPTHKDRADDFCSVAMVSVPQRAGSEAEAMALIGGADGPVSMVVGRAAAQPALHAASSALTFEAQAEVRWQPVFHVVACEDVTVKML